MLINREKQLIKSILLGFVESYTNADGVVPKAYEDIETIEEVAICKRILRKLNAITL
jgi:hypothetical protein